MSEIKIGQTWEHDSGDFSADVIGVCYEDCDVELLYNDDDSTEWITFDTLRTDYTLSEEATPVIQSVDDAEAAFQKSGGPKYVPESVAYAEKLAQIESATTESNVSFEDAEAAFTSNVPMSGTFEDAEAKFMLSVDSPLAEVKQQRIEGTIILADLLAIGVL